MVGLTNNIYKLNEIEEICKIIVPYLEKNISDPCGNWFEKI